MNMKSWNSPEQLSSHDEIPVLIRILTQSLRTLPVPSTDLTPFHCFIINWALIFSPNVLLKELVETSY